MENYSGKINKKKAVLLSIILGSIVVAFASCKKVTVEKIKLLQSSIELKVDESTYVGYSITPDKASDAEVTWESSDDSVAIVSSEGKITGTGDGTCTIEVTAGEETDSLKVVVKKEVPDFQKVFDECELDSSWATIDSDGSYLSIDTNPDNIEEYVEMEEYFSLFAIQEYFDLPESLMEEIKHTAQIDGKQSRTFEDINLTVTWKYDIYNGWQVMYKVAD